MEFQFDPNIYMEFQFDPNRHDVLTLYDRGRGRDVRYFVDRNGMSSYLLNSDDEHADVVYELTGFDEKGSCAIVRRINDGEIVGRLAKVWSDKYSESDPSSDIFLDRRTTRQRMGVSKIEEGELV